MNTTRPGQCRDESGAVAIMVATLSLVLLGVGAVAVDLGQVYAKRSSLQSAVDQAVLAAAAELDGSNICTTAAVTAAKQYLVDNWIDQTNDALAAGDINLTDDDRAAPGPDGFDGYMECTRWRVDLWAPTAKVEWGLAGAVVSDEVEDEGIAVPAHAAAAIESPKTQVMPAYGVSGCDYGPETLLDNSSGGTITPVIPSLPGTTDSASPAITTSSITVPSDAAIDVGEISSLEVAGNNRLADATHIGFATPTTGTNLNLSYPVTTKASGLVTLAEIPAAVRNTEGVWYVRVSRDGGATWSNSQTLQVGPPVLECAAAPTSGNFGALMAYRDPDLSTNARLAMNMAVGLDFSVTTFPVPASNWECTHGVAGAVESTNGNLRDGTNCFDTDTGLPAEATESGLLTGDGITEDGRLANRPTNSMCGRSDTTINFGGSVGSRTINNDILTCFFDNGTTRIGDLGESYAGDPVIVEEIFTSPRFYWIPILGKQTTSGGSNRYQIVDFRPAFITDQPDSATQSNPQVNTGGTENGLGFKDAGGKKTLRSVKVVFFNSTALPESISGGPTMDYLGFGTKVIVLKD